MLLGLKREQARYSLRQTRWTGPYMVLYVISHVSDPNARWRGDLIRPSDVPHPKSLAPRLPPGSLHDTIFSFSNRTSSYMGPIHRHRNQSTDRRAQRGEAAGSAATAGVSCAPCVGKLPINTGKLNEKTWGSSRETWVCSGVRACGPM